MDKMTAYCGLSCGGCPIHLATLEGDKDQQETMRASIAKLCSENYGMNLKPEEITDCDGCRANTGRLFSGCQNCEIRKCAISKKLETCAHCSDYACDILEEFFSHDPSAKTTLEEIRKNIC